MEQNEQKQRTVEDLNLNELKVLAFDINEKIKNLQRQQSQLYQLMNTKVQEGNNDNRQEDKSDITDVSESSQ